MVERDFEPFCGMLQDVWGFYPQAKVPSSGQMAMFFRAVSEHSIATVRAAFDAHVRHPLRGKYPPLPADVNFQIEGEVAQDGRPGPEEAWSIALQAADEMATLVWTEEISQAWGIARVIFAQGDEVGARMAFKEAYARLVLGARQAGKAAAWSETIGHDAEQRDRALERAYAAGLLPKPEQLRQLPAPNHALSRSNKSMPAQHRADIERVAEEMRAKGGRASVQWAERLKAREEGGERLTEAERAMWRAALDVRSLTEPIGGSFKGVAEECLPPGMRPDAYATEGPQ